MPKRTVIVLPKAHGDYIDMLLPFRIITMLQIVFSVAVATAFLYYGVFTFVVDGNVKQAGVICRDKHPNLTIVDLPIISDQVKLFATTDRSPTIKCYVLCLLRELYVFKENDEINMPLANATGILMVKYLGDLIFATHFIQRCKLKMERQFLTDPCDKAMYYGHCLHNMKKLTLAQMTGELY